uniref:ANK_REP_REGION domain-containing protein n=1 Tax=Hydatigena taeniaeformis TaxID=6205 RepID=A0A0R3WHX9_HYDTA
LHEVASKGFSRSLEALCVSKAPPNLQNKLGLTPLHVAAQNGHKQSIRVLLSSGADLGAVDNSGNTCLHTAVRYGRTGVVKILLTASANVMATNCNLETPLHIAASLKRTKIARCLLTAITSRGSISVMNTLTRMSGGGLQKQPSSPLPLASQPLPLTIQAALWMRNAQGETPLEVARRRLRNGSGSDMVSLLLERMNVTDCCSQYENGTTKSLPRPSTSSGDGGEATGNDHDVLLAMPCVSSDLIYSPVQKKTAFKFAFKGRRKQAFVSGVAALFQASATNRLHRPKINAADKASASCINEATVESPADLSSGLKVKLRSVRRSFFGGLFKSSHTKTILPALAGEMRKSESSQLPSPRDSKCDGNTEASLLEMPTSISVSEALNESRSSSFVGRSILPEISSSADDPLQNSLLLGRFQQLPLPQNSKSTSAGVSSTHLPEDVTATNNSDDRDCTSSHLALQFLPNLTSCASLSNCVSGSSGGGGGIDICGANECPRTRFGVRFDLNADGDAHAVPASVVHGRQLSMQLYRDLAGNLKKHPPTTRKSRHGRFSTATTAATTFNGKQQINSRSDESLSISGRLNKETPIGSAPPLKPADTLPDTGVRKSNGRPVSAIYEVVPNPTNAISYPLFPNTHY